MFDFGDYEAEKQVNPSLTTRHRNESKVLKEINDQVEKIEKREASTINKEKINKLAEKRSSSKDKKRRRTTHFTTNKHKKKMKPLLSRKGFKGMGRKMMVSKKALMNQRSKLLKS